jgi:uncharacterized protein
MIDNHMTPEQAALLAAVQRGDTTGVEKYLKDGASPNFSDAVGYTPLIVASIFDYADIAVLLIEHGANTRAADSSAWTAEDHALFNHAHNVSSLLRRSSRKKTPAFTPNI